MNTYRHAHNLDTQANSDANGYACSGPDMCRQEFADEDDILTHIRRHGAPQVRKAYGEHDFDVSLKDRLDASRKAAEAFRNLPEGVRALASDWVALLAVPEEQLKAALERPTGAPPDKAEQASTPATGL